ncbi:MAG TPA: hypothetical protein VJ732_16355, partial [Bryobacteraceae bacterium]|nr:hypothetical protein [Bryobacteraceae bacterium]
IDAPGRGPFPVPYQAPTTIDAAELFKIGNGKIRKIEAIQTNLPYGTGSPFAAPFPVGPPSLAISDLVQVPPPCDRRCLEAFVDRYLEAMVAHNPKGVPVQDPRYSEDDVELPFGSGLWRTASGLGKYKLYFADPQQGQVGFFGTIRENGKGAALALRLKVEHGLLREAEAVVVRNEMTFQSLEEAGTPDPVLRQTVPAAERLARDRLTAIANQYFEAIEQGNGGVAPFDPDCNRFENGRKTSGTLGCAKQLDTGIFDYIRRIYPRRFLVVDEERQLVFGFFMFNHPGNILWVNVPGEGRHEMPAAAQRPFSVDVAELFRIQNGKIRKVEALMTALPYGAASPYAPATR